MAKANAKAKERDQEPALFSDQAADAPVATKTTTAAPATKPAKRKGEKTGSEIVPFQQKAAPAPNMLSVIASLAANKNIDPAKMKELVELYQMTEAKQQFHDALIRIDLPTINRDGRIQNSSGKPLRFASFENVHKSVVPLLRQNGFRLSFQPMPGPNGEGLVVECKLIRGIYEEKCVVPISTVPASRAMNAQQSTGAAIKYASRYGMMYLLNLNSEALEDADTDGNDPAKVRVRRGKDGATEVVTPGAETITAAQIKDVLKEIDASGIDPTRFMDKYRIERVDDLPAKLFDEAVKALREYGAVARSAKK